MNYIYEQDVNKPGDNYRTSSANSKRKNTHFTSASLDKTVKVWKMGHNKEVKTIELSDAVWSASFSPDGKYIACCSQDGTVSIICFVN